MKQEPVICDGLGSWWVLRPTVFHSTFIILAGSSRSLHGDEIHSILQEYEGQFSSDLERKQNLIVVLVVHLLR
jgi:hypothetical protein